MTRKDGRGPEALRPISFERFFLKYAEGSVLVKFGDTHVICTASVEEGVPQFLRGSGKGWVTAEYAMLPRATQTRTARESVGKKPSGRSMEIQRLIGRSLRSVMDMSLLGERTVWIDCDVIQADGGTRTACITGGCVALYDALRTLQSYGVIGKLPMVSMVAAISVGIVDGKILLDLNYNEDSTASVDLNLVMTERGNLVEIQGTAEGTPFSKNELDAMISLGEKGIRELITLQKKALGIDASA